MEEYKAYIQEFVKTIDPTDQLPLRVSGYSLRDFEIHGEVLDWMMSYLGRSCPTMIRVHLIKMAIKETMEKVKTTPDDCGFDPERNSFQPLKLVKIVVAILNRMILDLQKEENLCKIPLPPSSPNASEFTKLTQPPKYSVDAIKNTRRTMEDKHMVIDDFNAFFNTQDTEPTFYYGIFDGHSGSDAASYAAGHLPYNVSVHPKYPSDIEKAMHAAFLVTDYSFLKKAHTENLSSGTTALCAIYRKTEKKLYVGWCGDSQALIARLGAVRQIVTKHSPEDESERKRIEALGGVVLYWGNSYRVNGQLAVSRSIGDMAHKPFISAEPEIECINLDGEEDFIVLGCDGLWDNLTEDDVAIFVYKKVKENPDSYLSIASNLCSLAKEQGSRDNISVIVVFLKEPQLIATQRWPSSVEHSETMENLNMYEESPVSNQVTMDALGNSNQEIYNNPFGDFTNHQLISDVSKGKSTEIIDLVKQQQPDNAFCNLTDTLNNINNNKFNNQDEDNFMIDQESPQHVELGIFGTNDSNNNSSNENLGPETNIDAIEDFEANASGAVGGVKENIQMEFKETEDIAARTEVMDFGANHSAGIFDTLQPKIFESMSFQNPDLIKGDNPFMSENFEVVSDAFIDNKFVEPVENFMDNKMVEEVLMVDAQHHSDHYDNLNEKATEVMKALQESEAVVADQLQSLADIEASQLQEAPKTDLGFVGVAQQQIGESGGEESEDEWNYVQVEKKASDILATVEETAESLIEEAAFKKNLFGQKDSVLSFNESNIIEDFSGPPIKNATEHEKEAEEEKHAQDDVGKDLKLSVETEDFDDMSQLNPEAKVFVPISPTRNEKMNPVNQLLNQFVSEDAVVSQSPRKGDGQLMEDILIPSEKDFDIEVELRPHEINPFVENGSGSPDVLNLKESLQKDDKLEKEYKDEAIAFFEEEKQQTCEVYKELESSFTEYSNGFQNVIDDPMNRSFYEGRDNGDIMAPKGRASDVLNTVQLLPADDDERSEMMTNSEGSILEFNKELDVLPVAPPRMDLSDNFETEHFLEEIKGATEKYIDQGLSPTLPEVYVNTLKNEAFEDKPPLEKETLQATSEEQNIELSADKFQGVDETNEKLSEQLEQKLKEEVAMSDIAVGTSGAIAKQEQMSATSTKEPDAKKADVKSKGPIAAKTNPITAKRAPTSSTTAAKTFTSTKLSSVAAHTRPAIRKTTSSVASSVVKSTSSTVPATKPVAPPVRRPTSATAPKISTDNAVKPAVAVAKKPATSLATSKPTLARPASAAVSAKPKLSNGTLGTERKTLASSAPSTRVPAKTTSHALLKSKVIGASKPATKPITSTRLSVTVAEKTAASPAKDRVLNRSVGTVDTKSPRPMTSAASAKPVVKDVKSSAISGVKASVSAKKPLLSVKKSPVSSTTTTTTVIKKSPSGIKKTATTTVVKTKVVNGNIIKDGIITTQTTSGDPQLIEEFLKATELSTHVNGNGSTEKGVNDGVQMVLDSAAD